jgi:hypothetical protein
MTSTRLLLLGLLVPAAFGLSATQARADGETLTLAQTDPTAMVDHAVNYTASGTLNPDDTMFGFDIYVFLKDPTVDPTCGPDFDSEEAAALHSGGHESWVSPAGGFQVGYGPTFDYPFKITYSSGGAYLLCGYVQGDFSTFATGELRGTVAEDTTPAPTPTPTPTPTPNPNPNPNPGPTLAAPAVRHAPRITRKHHVLTCHPGTWSNSPARFSYRWYLKGHRKAVASHRRLKVRHALKGRMVSCRVTASNAAGRKTAVSRSIRAR